MAKKEGSRVPDAQENMKLCMCGGCPTFKKSLLTEGFFCAKGKAKETVKQSGCNCGSCAVFKKYNLKAGYFCLK